MSLMRRNKLKFLPNLARKPLVPEKYDLSSVKVENETTNIHKLKLVENSEEIAVISENSPKIELQHVTCDKLVDQDKNNESKFIEKQIEHNEVDDSINGLSSSSNSDNHNVTGVESCTDKNYIKNESLLVLPSVVEKDRPNYHEISNNIYSSVEFHERPLNVKDKSVSEDCNSSSDIIINSHESPVKESASDKHFTTNFDKGKQSSRINLSTAKKVNKKIYSLSRGGKENATVSKLSFSETNKSIEERNSPENTNIKNENTRSILNQSKKHKTRHVKRKSSPYFERKFKYRSKLTPSGELEKSKMTMFDLIFWNPSSNPMPRNENDDAEVVIRNNRAVEFNNTNNSNNDDSTSAGIEEQEAEEEGLDISDDKKKNADFNTQEDTTESNFDNESHENLDHASESEEENATLAPQVKIGPNGELIVDEKSLLIQTTAAKNRDKILSTTEIVEEDNNSSHYGKWSKRKKKSTDWTRKETARFYKALSTVGTDFSLMSMILNWRTRAELKLKFKKEEKLNRHLIDMALNDSTQFDFSIFDESDYDPEEDRKKAKEAEKEEAKQKKEEERREKRLQRANEKKLKLEQEKLDKSRKRKLKSVYKKIRRRKKNLLLKEEPVEIKRRKRNFSVTIDPQEVICEVVFSSEKANENNRTVSENNISSHQNFVVSLENGENFGKTIAEDTDPLSTVPFVDVGEEDMLTISEASIISNEENVVEEREESDNKLLKYECDSLAVETLPNDLVNVSATSQCATDLRKSFELEVEKDKEDETAVPLALPPIASPDLNLVVMATANPSNPSEQIYHVYKIAPVSQDDAPPNSDPGSELINYSNNNEDSRNNNDNNVAL